MTSILKMMEAAEAAGFVRTECVHETPQHLVYDYPAPFRDGQVTRFWRVHTDMSKVPHVTYIGGTDVREHRATLVRAIQFMQQVASEHPKKGS